MSSDECYDVDYLIESDSADGEKDLSSSEVKSSDECYNACIVYDTEKDDPSISKSIVKRKRTKKTTVEQFQKLTEFMNSHNKQMLGKSAYGQLWDILVTGLNKLGPPSHSSDEWKYVWFNYKSKNVKKHKHSTMETLQLADTSSYSKTEYPIEQQASSSSAVVVIKDKRSSISNERTLKSGDTIMYPEDPKEHKAPLLLSPSKRSENENNVSLKVFEKLDAIVEQIMKLNTTMEAMVDEMKNTNEHLQKLLTK